MSDNVKSPNHYTAGGIETIDYLRAKLTPDQFQGYCLGNVLKYCSRYQHKAGVEDLKKAQIYLGWLIASADEKEENQHPFDAASAAIDAFERENKVMNIYSKQGEKVIFLNRNATEGEREYAINRGLLEGAEYTVDTVSVGGWCSEVYLIEFPGNSFNTVMFSNADERP